MWVEANELSVANISSEGPTGFKSLKPPPRLTGKVLGYLELPLFEHTGKPAQPDNLILARELDTHLPTYHTSHISVVCSTMKPPLFVGRIN